VLASCERRRSAHAGHATSNRRPSHDQCHGRSPDRGAERAHHSAWSKTAVHSLTADPKKEPRFSPTPTGCPWLFTASPDDFLPKPPQNARHKITDAEIVTLCVADPTQTRETTRPAPRTEPPANRIDPPDLQEHPHPERPRARTPSNLHVRPRARSAALAAALIPNHQLSRPAAASRPTPPNRATPLI